MPFIATFSPEERGEETRIKIDNNIIIVEFVPSANTSEAKNAAATKRDRFHFAFSLYIQNDIFPYVIKDKEFDIEKIMEEPQGYSIVLPFDEMVDLDLFEKIFTHPLCEKIIGISHLLIFLEEAMIYFPNKSPIVNNSIAEFEALSKKCEKEVSELTQAINANSLIENLSQIQEKFASLEPLLHEIKQPFSKESLPKKEGEVETNLLRKKEKHLDVIEAYQQAIDVSLKRIKEKITNQIVIFKEDNKQLEIDIGTDVEIPLSSNGVLSLPALTQLKKNMQEKQKVIFYANKATQIQIYQLIKKEDPNNIIYDDILDYPQAILRGGEVTEVTASSWFLWPGISKKIPSLPTFSSFKLAFFSSYFEKKEKQAVNVEVSACTP